MHSDVIHYMQWTNIRFSRFICVSASHRERCRSWWWWSVGQQVVCTFAAANGLCTWHLSTVKMFVWCALTVRRSPCSWLQYNFDQFSCIACLACHTWMHYALLSSCTLQAKCTANASVVAIHSPTLCWRFCGLHFTHLCRIAVCVRVSNPLCPGPLHFIEGKCIKPFIKTTHMHGHVSQFVQPKYVSMWHIILANAHLPRILWRMAEQLSG